MSDPRARTTSNADGGLRATTRANIVLTGFMGSGKTTVGRLLARRLGRRFVDTDDIIVERHGPIAEIFARAGENDFRRIEAEVAVELAAEQGLVIATGGRLMLDDANAAALGGTGRVFCLNASVDEILARVLGDDDGPVRPLLAGDDPADRVATLLAERSAGYGRFPQVMTTGRTPDEIADEIIERVEQWMEKQ